MSTVFAAKHKSPLNIFYRGLGRTLFLWFMVISLIPLTVVSLVSWWNAQNSLRKNAVDSLTAAIKLKEDHFASYFSERLKNLRLQVELSENVEFLQRMREAFIMSGLPIEQFINTPQWSTNSRSRGGYFDEFRFAYDFYDVLLIDNDGNILFSVMGEDDLGTNIFTDQYSDTNFSKACWQTLQTGKPVVGDLEFYKPAHDALVMFLVQAIADEHGDHVGLMAFKMPIHQINDIMQVSTGLGETGQTYLVGRDMMMRSDSSQFAKKSTMLTAKINTKPVRAYVKEHLAVDEIQNGHNQKGDSPENNQPDGFDQVNPEEWVDVAQTYLGPKGLPVLGVISDFEFLHGLGLHWAIVAEIEKQEAFRPAQILKNIVYGLATLTGILVVLLALLVTRRIVVPVKELSEWAKMVAVGDLDYHDIRHSKDEVGELSESFHQVVDSFRKITDICQSISVGDYSRAVQSRSKNDLLAQSVNLMAENLRNVVRQANAVAEGNYNIVFIPKSEKDELETALHNMTTRLRQMTDENLGRDWMRAGEVELHNIMRGEQDVSSLCSNVIKFLAEYLNCFVAAFYVADDAGVLKLSGSYAYKQQPDFAAEFHVGDGLVGQVAEQEERLLITEVPAEYVKIRSGVGEATPHSIVLFPLVFGGNVSGVIELGSFFRFSDLQLEFLDRVAKNIAISLNMSKSRSKMRELLDKQKRQAEQLRSQQKELWKTYETLEDKTKLLEKSEKDLQNQQEELRVANEELEERTQALEEQRDAVRKQNVALEKTQKELEEIANDLEVANKYKSEFLANMSHELRTPLNSILILSQLLATNKEGNLDEKQVEFVSTIHTSGSDLLEIINDILDLSKVESGKMELNLGEMYLEEMVHPMERLFGQIAENKGLEFKIVISEDVPESILTDEQRVQQILKNLLSNAFKFTQYGEVVLSISRPSSDTDLKSGLQPDTAVAIAISDTGMGIPSDKKEVIFEAFKQVDGSTNRKFGGTGLGLSISREFAKFLSGELHLESEEGMGTVFTLYLPERVEGRGDIEKPVKNDIQISATGKTVKKSSTVRTNKKIEKKISDPFIPDDRKSVRPGDKSLLIIEDDPDFAGVLVSLAREKIFKCLVAEDGETGLHFADYYKPSGIILDISLPGINGWEVMERLKDNPQTRHIPVHFMSSMDKSIDAMRMGAIGYMTKPVNMEKIQEAFGAIENFASKPVKKLLIVEDDEVQRLSIKELIGNGDVVVTDISSGKDAFDLLKKESFDCIILDLGLKDMSGFELLESIKNDEALSRTPIIVNTGKDLSVQEEAELKKYAESIIVKGVRSSERLLEETNLFLHRVEKELPEEMKHLVTLAHDKEAVLMGKKVLLVDDDMRNVFAIGSVLEERGMKIIMGRNGNDGLENLDKEPDIDIVLMDIMMPEMDGYDAIREIRKQDRFRELPIIALTAKAMKGDRNKCIEVGANDYLAKPVEIDKLLSLLRVWLYR